MDSPPPPPSPTASSAKLRLMCSYGGHIFPRPQTKSLHYLGGETRIISFPTPTATASISDFISHISAALRYDFPFYLKYQLPQHDLDSLISLSTDEDLNVMLEEHNRLSNSDNHNSSRIRVFVFTAKNGHRLEPVPGEEKPRKMKVLQHPKTEAWFFDALKSARMMEEAQSEGESLGGGGGLYTQESMVLDTTSSFGSTASSNSLSNLPAKVGNLEENVTLPRADYVASDYSVGSYMTHPQFESESNFSSGVQIRQPVNFSGYQQQQPLHFVQMGPNYITQNPTGVQSYYPSYNTLPHQQFHYPPNQSYPVYLVRAPQPQVPTNYNMVDSVNIAPLQPPVHPSATLLSHRVPVIESSAQIYRTSAVMHVPYNGNQQPFVIQRQPQPMTASNEVDDETERDQIYKSQPPPPVVVPPQNQTMTKASVALISEAMAQMHVENVNQG